MSQLEKTLSLGAKNSTVYSFKQLVYYQLGEKDVNFSSTRVAELDKDLYDKAMSLPLVASTPLKYLDNEKSAVKYGKFKGGNTFKSLNGDIDKSNEPSCEGWLTESTDSNEYVIFSNSVKGFSFIIASSDFEPLPLVEDFMPLYKKLQEYSYNTDPTFVKNLYKAESLAVSYRGFISDIVNNKLYQLWLIYMGAYRLVGEFMYLISLFDGKKLPSEKLIGNKYVDEKIEFGRDLDGSAEKYVDEKIKLGRDTSKSIERWADSENEDFYKIGRKGIYPEQIGRNSKSVNESFSRLSAPMETQAVIYDLPNDSDPYDGGSVLYCMQQPESISYTAAAQFDSASPRGAQQPFQFYQLASAISLSFTLKWHIDEVRSLFITDNENKKAVTLQHIAQIAEDFTRPWENGNSISPKLVNVVLPGFEQVGYITQAQIEYSGDMSGQDSDVYVKDKKRWESVNALLGSSMYTYSQLSITFELLMIRDDIKLINRDSASEGAIDNSNFSKLAKLYEDQSQKDIDAENEYKNKKIKGEDQSSQSAISLEPTSTAENSSSLEDQAVTVEKSDALEEVQSAVQSVSVADIKEAVSNAPKVMASMAGIAEAIAQMNKAAIALIEF